MDFRCESLYNSMLETLTDEQLKYLLTTSPKEIRAEMTIRELSLNMCTTEALVALRKRGVGLSILEAIDFLLLRREKRISGQKVDKS